MSEPFHHHTLRGGDQWSRVVRRGTALRLVDRTGRAAVAALFFNAAQPLERYCMPDTLKAQHTAFLTAGRVLFSDMGRVLCSITRDTRGWHDTVTGHLDAEGTRARWGDGGYQRLRNDRHRNTRDNLLVELAKHGLGERDLHANLNCFVEIRADAAGRLRRSLRSVPGAELELRMEMDVLVVLSNTPHPLDEAAEYAPPPVELELRRVPPPGADDPCRTGRPETARGFLLTEEART